MQSCPRCKTKLPANAAVCMACGMRLNAAPSPKVEAPAADAPVSAKTTFGMMSPIAAKPAAAKPVAAPVKAAWGMPKPQSKSQPIPVQESAPAPSSEPVPARTMFGVGMAVQPAPKAAPAPEPEPSPVPPRTMFGVGAAASAAPAAPSYAPPPEAYTPSQPADLEPAPSYQPEPAPSYQPEPTPQPIRQVEPLARAHEAALAETMPAPEASAAPISGASLASIQERDFLGADVELPRQPPALEGSAVQMPDAPASPAGLLFYFLKVLGARVELLSQARKLEAETKLWQERVGYLLATIGLRSPNLSAEVREIQSKISSQAQQQQAAMGERGEKLKAYEEQEISLNRDIVERESAYSSLSSQLKEIEAVRRDLQNKMKQPMPPLELANELTKTDGPYNSLKTQTEAARIALQDLRTRYNSTVKSKKQMLKDTESQMRASNEQLAKLRDELKKLLQNIGQEALLQGASAAASCRSEIEAVNQGIAARQSVSQQLRTQMAAIDSAKFTQGAGAFGGVVLVVFLVLFLLRPTIG